MITPSQIAALTGWPETAVILIALFGGWIASVWLALNLLSWGFRAVQLRWVMRKHRKPSPGRHAGTRARRVN